MYGGITGIPSVDTIVTVQAYFLTQDDKDTPEEHAPSGEDEDSWTVTWKATGGCGNRAAPAETEAKEEEDPRSGK